MPDAGLEELLTAVGLRVAQARRTAGLTQERLAGLTSIDVKRLQRIEGGGVNITLKTLWRLAQCLDCQVQDLMRVERQLRLAANPEDE